MHSGSSLPRASVLIPAYNEAVVIGTTLRGLFADMRPGEFEIIVVANGCHDDTAATARAACPDAVVLETATPGKANALRLGMERASAGYLVFLDADLLVGADAIRHLVAPLEDGRALASHGHMSVDLEGCSPVVTAFYKAWAQRDYLRNGKFGGLFAISRKGLARALPLPDLIADDEYFARHFSASEKTCVDTVLFRARAPRRLGDLFCTRKRVLRGTRELARHVPSRRSAHRGWWTELPRLALRPAMWPAFAVYAAVSLAVRAALTFETGPSPAWERDESSRVSVS